MISYVHPDRPARPVSCQSHGHDGDGRCIGLSATGHVITLTRDNPVAVIKTAS